MGLNQNHLVEELGTTRCAIVEKNILQERADFLTALLSGNGYTVVVAVAAPPKAKAAKPAAAEAETAEAPAPAETPAAPLLFNLGVTDLSFNPVNALYGRLLRDPKGHVVTPAYWNQQDPVSHDEVPYYVKAN